MAARPRRVREEWGEALHPPVDRDVIDLDPTLTQQLLHVAIGEPIPQIPAHGEDDDLRREPEAPKDEFGTAGTGRERRGLIPPPSPPTRPCANATVLGRSRCVTTLRVGVPLTDEKKRRHRALALDLDRLP